ncbi:MAG: hypothetical protein QE279_01300 [Rhodoferax sp.]|nr:hypothetical protein [Rhodoferax sp.]
MKLITLIITLLSFGASIAQDDKAVALDQVATCGALSYINTAILVPSETVNKISAFDNDAKRYLKSDQANLKKANEGFALRAGFFKDLYHDISRDEKLTNGQYTDILEKKYLYFKNIILNDDSFSVNMATLYSKCQAYLDAFNQIPLKDKQTNFAAISIKIINKISKQTFVANDQQVGVMFIAGSHWKYLNFIHSKSIKDALNNLPPIAVAK